MDVSKLNVEKACSIPKRMSIVSPYDGTTLIDENGKTLDIFVYGINSSIARNAMNDRLRRRGNKKEEDSKEGAKFLEILTQGYSDNIENEEGPYKTAYDMYMSEDWIAKQVVAFSKEDSNYDPNA